MISIRILPLVPVLSLFLLSVACAGAKAPKDDCPTTTNDDGKPAECVGDAECVPEQCCHPTSCVPVSEAPDCTDVACTLECVPGTMDCGQGQCECIGGTCTAVIDDVL